MRHFNPIHVRSSSDWLLLDSGQPRLGYGLLLGLLFSFVSFGVGPTCGLYFCCLVLGSSLLPLWLPLLSWESSRCTVAFLILLQYIFLEIQSLNIQNKKTKISGLAIIHVRANDSMIEIVQYYVLSSSCTLQCVKSVGRLVGVVSKIEDIFYENLMSSHWKIEKIEEF